MSSVRGGAAVAPPRSSPLTKVPYLPGLDGLRALAVTAVVLYHGGATWMQGGFLGVEVFFVISGYLITLLLIAEHDRTGRISLKGFWLRRARRLLPALYVLLVGVAVWCALFVRDELAELRGQIVAALLYVTNWYLIATDQSYFDNLGRPDLLQHLWSLAVEEQFYLAWPFVMAVLLFVCRRRLGVLAAVLATMAAASTIWMAVLYTPGEDPSRVYYGTDTRAAALIVGALLALFWRPSALARGQVAAQGRSLDLVGLGGLGLLALLMTRATETGPFLYYGGFLLCSVATLGVIAAVAHPYSILSKVLGLQPLRYLGTRSYGIYLWHWPIFVLTRPGVDVDWSAGRLWGFRIGLTLALSELSYRLVETPIRNGGLSAWFRSLTGPATLRRDGRRRFTVGVAGASLAVLVPVGAVIATASPYDPIADSLRAGQQVVGTVAGPGAGALGGGAASAVASTPTDSVPADSVAAAAGTTAAGPDTDVPDLPAATTAPGTPVQGGETTVAAETVAPDTTAPPDTPAPPTPYPVVAIGDSVMLGAAPALSGVLPAGSYIDAVVGRQFLQAKELVDSLRAQGLLGSTVVVHLGNNGPTNSETFQQLMASLADVPKVLFLTVKVERKWEAGVNQVLYDNVPAYPNAKIIYWRDLAEPNRGWFYDDGIHLRAEGAAAYAQIVQANL